MRLSEAILLGDSLRVRESLEFLGVRDGRCIGCALGGAWLAAGKTPGQWEYGALAEANLQRVWPWLTNEHIREISGQFHNVVWRRQTLEQLADYVRSIEPAEPGETVSGEGPNQVTERAELLKVKEVKAEELETMPR